MSKCRIAPPKESFPITHLLQLYDLSLQLNRAFDFNRFLALDNAKDLEQAGDYFFEKEAWEQAKQLYEKLAAKQNNVDAPTH